MRDRGRDTQRDNRTEWEGEKRCWTLSKEGKGNEPHWEHYPTLYGQRARSGFPHSSCKQRAFWFSPSLKDMDDYSIMWPQSSPAVHTYTVATHRVTPVDIYKVTLLMERRPLDKRRQHVHLHKGTKICKNLQSFLEIRMCVHTNEHNMSYLEIFWHHTHTHISAKRGMGSIQPLSLFC